MTNLNSKFTINVSTVLFILICVCFNGINALSNNNLTCYQCERKTDETCLPQELLPCPPVSDRCVTHISKSSKNGLSIKRECGLGPCGFDDVMANKGLGLDICDRNRNEYFCIFCCRENGCNHAISALHKPPLYLCSVILVVIFMCT